MTTSDNQPRAAAGAASRAPGAWLAREWARYAGGFREEDRGQLKPSSLVALALFGGGVLALMTLVPAARLFTGFEAPGTAFALLGAALAASYFAGRLWHRRRLREVLLLLDTTGYCSLMSLLMVETSSPTRYVFGLILGQMATDLGRRAPFSAPMVLAVCVIPTAVALTAWPDFAVLALALFASMMFVYTSITTEEQRRLRLHNQRLQSAFEVADRVASSSVEIALAASVAEIGGFVHHLRNALTPVVSHLRLLRASEVLGDDARFSVEAALRGADRSVEYLEKLVDSMKRRSSTTLSSFSLDEVLREAAEALGEDAPSLALHVDGATDFEVTGNPDQLRLAIDNLVRNGLEAGASRVEVRARLVAGAQEVALTISDDGRGIPLEIRAALFEQPVTHGKVTGHGFGLYFSRRLVELLGGRLTLVSTGASGTAFEIALPGRSRPASGPREPTASAG